MKTVGIILLLVATTLAGVVVENNCGSNSRCDSNFNEQAADSGVVNSDCDTGASCNTAVVKNFPPPSQDYYDDELPW